MIHQSSHFFIFDDLLQERTGKKKKISLNLRYITDTDNCIYDNMVSWIGLVEKKNLQEIMI
jgi:hypothetical protein